MHRLRNVSGGSGNPRTANYLNKSIVETFNDDNPLDDDGEISVERFFDFKTGDLKKNPFTHIWTYVVHGKAYKVINIPDSTRTFVIDLDNKECFRGLEKGTHGSIEKILEFGNRNIAIINEMDEYRCMDDKGNQISNGWEKIHVIKHNNEVNILQFIQEGGRTFYLGSDGYQYKSIQTRSETDGTGHRLEKDRPCGLYFHSE